MGSGAESVLLPDCLALYGVVQCPPSSSNASPDTPDGGWYKRRRLELNQTSYCIGQTGGYNYADEKPRKRGH